MNIIRVGEPGIQTITGNGSKHIIKNTRRNLKNIREDTGVKELYPGIRIEGRKKFMDQKIIYIGSIREYLELDKKKTKNPKKYESITIIVDMKKLKKERSDLNYE
ncbi:hypothetical protein ES707_13831 [subsurface metagenome]